MDVFLRILVYAEELFLKMGVRSITLGDIASGLGISKKTIYHYFQNKADLVLAVANRYLGKEEEEIDLQLKHASDAIEELIRLSDCKNRNVPPKMFPALVLEVQKFYPETWEAIQQHTWGYFSEKLRANLTRGIGEQLYRNDLPIDQTVRIFLAQIEAGQNPELFPPDKFNHMNTQKQLFEMFLHGIVTESGRQLLAQYFKPSSSASAA